MSENVKREPLPLPTIRRYPVYIRAIQERIDGGETTVSSAALAEQLGLDPVLARKDLAMVGVPGRPRLGYPAKELVAALRKSLGWDNATEAALVGAGSLGKALLGHKGFAQQKLSITIAFDADPAIAGTSFKGVQIRPVSELPTLLPRLRLTIGILCVPDEAAQSCADVLVAAGVRGIWNFTAVQLRVPKNTIVQNVNLAQSLAVLSHAISVQMESLPWQVAH